MVDDVEGEPYQETAWPATVSRHGHSVAFSAAWEGKRYVVFNGKRGPPLPRAGSVGFTLSSLGRFRPLLSDDGSTLAYIVQADKSYVVVGETPGPSFDEVDGLVISAKGESVAYRADNFIVFNGMKIGPFEEVSTPSVTPDGGTLAYGVKTKVGWELVIGKNRIAAVHPVAAVFVNAEGTRAAYQTGTGPNARIVIDEAIRGRFGWRYPPIFGPDQKTVAYYDGQRVIAGKRESVPYDDIGPISFSPDGRQVMFGARRGRELLRVVMAVE